MTSIMSGIFGRGWTLSDLLRIDSGRQQRAQDCRVSLIDTYSEVHRESIPEKFKKLFTRRKDTLNIFEVIFKFKVVSVTGSVNTVIIKTFPDYVGTEYMNNKVQVWCSCKDFMFKSAWLLGQHDALFRSANTDSKLGTAITDSPKTGSKTSPLCKHSYAAVMYLASNYQNLMTNA